MKIKLVPGTLVHEFACHSNACRPPTSGGTGGSTPGAGKVYGYRLPGTKTWARIAYLPQAGRWGIESNNRHVSGKTRFKSLEEAEDALRSVDPMISALSAAATQAFACHSKACAPPPAGKGGSMRSGRRTVKITGSSLDDFMKGSMGDSRARVMSGTDWQYPRVGKTHGRVEASRFIDGTSKPVRSTTVKVRSPKARGYAVSRSGGSYGQATATGSKSPAVNAAYQRMKARELEQQRAKLRR